MIHNKFRFILTLVALLAVTTGAWADETPLLTIESKDYKIFTSGSKTFDDKVTITFSGSVYNDGDECGWFTFIARTLTVTAAEGYTITSCKFYTFDGPEANGYTIEGESPSVYLTGEEVYTDASQSVYIGYPGVTKIEVFGAAASAATGPEVAWNKASKTGTFKMPGGNVELEPEYYPGMLTLGGAIEGGKLEVVGMDLGTTSFTVPSEWNHNITKLASSHFEGFKGVTEEEAKAWTGVPATGLVALFYNYDETAQKWDMIYFKDGAFYDIYKGYVQQLATIYNLSKSNFSVFYTTGMQMPAGFEKDEEGNIYVEPGTKFQVKVVPDEGFHLVSLTDGTNDIEVDADGIATITMPDEYADLTLTATFSNEYNVALNAEGLSDEEAAAWKAATGDNDPAALPLENVKYGTEVKVTYTGSKKVIGVKAEKKAAAPATVLSGALVDGAIIKVNFKWRGVNGGDYLQGVYNAASGTFTVSKGGDYWGSDGRAVYKVEKSGDNIIIGAGFRDYVNEGMVWTFNTTNDTYTTTNGIIVNQDWDPGDFDLISVTLNGTDITSQLTAQ